MFPDLPYHGFTWQITQHTGIVCADTIVGLLRGCAHLDGHPIDISAIDTRLAELGRFASETGRSLWRDYQQVLSEFGFIVSSASNDGILKLTPVAKELLAGRISFGEAMTLQLLRYQYANGFKRTIPKNVMFNDGSDVSRYDTLTDIQEVCGVRIRPFVCTWEVMDSLSKTLKKPVRLSVDEMARFVLRCSSHADIRGCCDAILSYRNGNETIADQGDNVKRNAADWMKLLTATSVFSIETEGRKASIALSELSIVHADALRWFFMNFNNEKSFWSRGSGEDWFSFYGKIDSGLINLFCNQQYNLGWLMPSFVGGMKIAVSQQSHKTTANAPIRQRIIYGAPGTGKSHGIEDVVGKYADTVRTTFHPDSDYASFVGCYKPTMVRVKKTYVLEGRVAEVKDYEDSPVFEERIAYSYVPQAFTSAYVRAWRKMLQGTDGNVAPQFLIVEEINRGNCAQIFGDLFQLLDRDDNGYSKYPIEADADLSRYIGEELGKLPPDMKTNIPPEVLSGEKLVLPPNLYIWATMNTSDQSLFPIDSAFKRRWEWKYMPISDAGKGWKIEVAKGEVYDWWAFLEKANALVQNATDSEDKKLGYFFCKADASGNITLEQFVGKVIFYLWNDVFKDAGFEDDAFNDGIGGRLQFKDFFNCDGSPIAAAVRKFMGNLGVAKLSSPADGAEVSEEGTEL